MHPTKSWHYETLARRAVEALKGRDFGAVYAPTAAEARRAVLGLIPDGSTIGFGGSISVETIGVPDLLREGNYHLINPPWVEKPLSREERWPLRKQALLADVFLTGTNAVTLDGCLVNTDNTANRVAGMLFGPKRTIVVAGVNKIVRTVSEALERVANEAAPVVAKRLNCNTPCTITGVCSDCQSADRICRATVILHRRTVALDLTVIMVGEELGF